MWIVDLPHSMVYVELYDRESPWGTTYTMEPELTSWLDRILGDDGWDYDDTVELSDLEIRYLVRFTIAKKRTAILMQLRYGVTED